jgi:putative transposase
VSRLRRLVLSDRYFFLTVRLLKTRTEMVDGDFRLLAEALREGRQRHGFRLTAWVFLPDHWHAILYPPYPLTVSQAMKAVKLSSMILINRRRGEVAELWQGRFFDRALRTVKEYNEKVEYIHLNPVRRGLVARPQDWRWSSVLEYSGGDAGEQERRCGLAIDRVRLPAEPKARI